MKEFVKNIVEETDGLVTAKIEQTRLETVEKSINIPAGSLSLIVLTVVGLLTLMVFTTGFIVLLAHLMDSLIGATLIILGVYAIIFVLLIVFKREVLINPIKNLLFGEYLDNYKIKKHE